MFQSFSHSSSPIVSHFLYLLWCQRQQRNGLCCSRTNLKTKHTQKFNTPKKVHHSLPIHHPSPPPKAFGVFQRQQQLAEQRRRLQHVVHYSQRELHSIIPLIRLITAPEATLAIDMMIDPQQSVHRAALDLRDLQELAVFYRAYYKVNSTSS